MRLTPDEVEAIRRTTREVFGDTAVVRLFGSRVDDSKRGGDIDLYVEADPDAATFDHECRFLRRLEDRIGERRIDVVLHQRGKPHRPIEAIAMATGVVL